jgi:hypothetical protein
MIDEKNSSLMTSEKDSALTSGGDVSKDVEEPKNIGHVEELRRDFSIWSLASLCLCLMGTVRILAFPPDFDKSF